MKNKKLKVLTCTLALTFTLGLAACSLGDKSIDDHSVTSSQEKNKNNTKQMEKDHKLDQLMLEVTKWNGDLLDLEKDDWVATTYYVYYNGKIETEYEYTMSGKKSELSAMMSDEEWKQLYWFSTGQIDHNDFTEYKEEADDGVSWSFVAYDTKGVKYDIYSGYCYNNAKLGQISDAVSGYVLEKVVPVVPVTE